MEKTFALLLSVLQHIPEVFLYILPRDHLQLLIRHRLEATKFRNFTSGLLQYVMQKSADLRRTVLRSLPFLRPQAVTAVVMERTVGESGKPAVAQADLFSVECGDRFF